MEIIIYALSISILISMEKTRSFLSQMDNKQEKREKKEKSSQRSRKKVSIGLPDISGKKIVEDIPDRMSDKKIPLEILCFPFAIRVKPKEKGGKIA